MFTGSEHNQTLGAASEVPPSHFQDPCSRSCCPEKPLYEARPSAWGIGAFATRSIPPGTRIICEGALFSLPEEADAVQVSAVVKALPAAEQAAFLALAASTKPYRDEEWIAQLRSQHDDASTPLEAVIEEHLHVMSIYETNRFTIRNADGSSDKLGIFPKAARLNSSCRPNAFHRFNANINRLTIHSLRTIEPGEEILTSYIDICHPTVERRRLLSHWGFKCKCTACVAKDINQDWRRSRIEKLFERMRRFESRRPRGDWSEWDYAQAYNLVEEMARLMEEEGMEESDTLGEACRNAAEYSLRIGWKQQAVEWAERLVQIEKKCCGDDSPDYEKAVMLLQSAKSA